MQSAHLQPYVLDGLCQKLYAGDQLDAAQARQLLAEVDLLREELASARKDFARKAAGALEKRLKDVAAFNHGGCRTCRDGEARAFLAKLQRIADVGAVKSTAAGGTWRCSSTFISALPPHDTLAPKYSTMPAPTPSLSRS